MCECGVTAGSEVSINMLKMQRYENRLIKTTVQCGSIPKTVKLELNTITVVFAKKGNVRPQVDLIHPSHIRQQSKNTSLYSAYIYFRGGHFEIQYGAGYHGNLGWYPALNDST